MPGMRLRQVVRRLCRKIMDCPTSEHHGRRGEFAPLDTLAWAVKRRAILTPDLECTPAGGQVRL
jgi:hypothetical protein